VGESAGPAFAVHVDEAELAEDLAHATDAAQAAIKPVIERLREEGVPSGWLGRCDTEARDGTRLGGCVKLYIPQPAGQWGAVFLGGAVADKPTLFLLAVGERHPGAPWKPSVYEIAHRRLHREEGADGEDSTAED
jgi:hypothetical protein